MGYVSEVVPSKSGRRLNAWKDWVERVSFEA